MGSCSSCIIKVSVGLGRKCPPAQQLWNFWGERQTRKPTQGNQNHRLFVLMSLLSRNQKHMQTDITRKYPCPQFVIIKRRLSKNCKSWHSITSLKTTTPITSLRGWHGSTDNVTKNAIQSPYSPDRGHGPGAQQPPRKIYMGIYRKIDKTVKIKTQDLQLNS